MKEIKNTERVLVDPIWTEQVQGELHFTCEEEHPETQSGFVSLFLKDSGSLTCFCRHFKYIVTH